MLTNNTSFSLVKVEIASVCEVVVNRILWFDFHFSFATSKPLFVINSNIHFDYTEIKKKFSIKIQKGTMFLV